MTLWTIQNIGQYNNLLQEGYISGNSEYIYPLFSEGYKWMIDQMHKRLSNKPNSSSHPIWAWYQFENSKKKKPDLRYKGIAGEKGEEFVLLDINKDETEVLLSDFDLWHFPLSYQSYIGDSEEDTLLFEQELTNLGFDSKLNNELPPFYANKIIDSWNKIFDLNYEEPYFTYPKDQKSIQATFWKLSLSEVASVRYFISK